ncbi:Kelch motif protein [compost metagenome]
MTITANSGLKLKSKLAFNKLAPLKKPIASFGSCIKDGKIYIVGGSDSYESNALETLKAKNINSEDPNFLQKYLSELSSQNSLISYKGDFLIYDIKKNSWTTLNSKKELLITLLIMTISFMFWVEKEYLILENISILKMKLKCLI